MGWKTLKQLLLANGHPVAMSHSVNATISQAMTGNHQAAASAINQLVVAASHTSNGITQSQIKNAIAVTDTFTASIPVYSYEDGAIIEKLCEKPGNPNLTHDGDLMYDNTWTTDPTVNITRATEDTEIAVSNSQRTIANFKAQIEQAEKELVTHQAWLEHLKAL